MLKACKEELISRANNNLPTQKRERNSSSSMAKRQDNSIIEQHKKGIMQEEIGSTPVLVNRYDTMVNTAVENRLGGLRIR